MPNTTNSWLGIDFGTCSTSAAMLVGRELRQVNLSQSQFAESPDMPTAVFIEPEGRIVVGYQALRSRLRDPSRYLDSFKLEIERTPGRILPVAGASKIVPWSEIVAAVLHHVKAIAEKDLNNGLPIPCAVLTVPALYAQNGTGWEIMEQAGKMAGFERVRIVREPHAAALYYDHLIREARQDTGGDGELVLVYDLGGGTFDPALIRRGENKYPVERAQGAGVRCGGIFFDRELNKDFKRKCLDGVVKLVPPQRSPDGTIPESQADVALSYARAVVDIDKFLIECKHSFSQPETHQFDEPAPPHFKTNYRLTRAEFDALLSPLLDSTIKCCEELLKLACVGWKDLSRVILVGGSCSLPTVHDKIASAMKRAGADESRICWQRIPGTDKVVDPRFAVARGASLISTELDEPEDSRAKITPTEAPPILREGQCPNCGTQNHPGSTFCANCGSTVRTGILPPYSVAPLFYEPTPSPSPKPLNRWFTCCLGIVGLTVFGWLCIFVFLGSLRHC